jgi:hypothetical protein
MLVTAVQVFTINISEAPFAFKLIVAFLPPHLLFSFLFFTVLQIFDRDEPTREKEVYLSVRATDNGQPTLDDTCTIKVTIEDVNDNLPVFDKVVSVGCRFRFTFNCFIGILLAC